MTKPEAAKLVKRLSQCFSNPIWPLETIRAYAEEILMLDFARTERAVTALIRTSKFRPSIAEIHNYVKGIGRNPSSDDLPEDRPWVG